MKTWILILATILLSFNCNLCVVYAEDSEPIIDDFTIPVDFDVKVEYLGNNRISIQAEVIPREDMDIEAAVNLSGALKKDGGTDTWTGVLTKGRKGTISLTSEIIRDGRIHEILIEAKSTEMSCCLAPASTSRYVIFKDDVLLVFDGIGLSEALRYDRRVAVMAGYKVVKVRDREVIARPLSSIDEHLANDQQAHSRYIDSDKSEPEVQNQIKTKSNISPDLAADVWTGNITNSSYDDLKGCYLEMDVCYKDGEDEAWRGDSTFTDNNGDYYVDWTEPFGYSFDYGVLTVRLRNYMRTQGDNKYEVTFNSSPYSAQYYTVVFEEEGNHEVDVDFQDAGATTEKASRLYIWIQRSMDKASDNSFAPTGYGGVDVRFPAYYCECGGAWPSIDTYEIDDNTTCLKQFYSNHEHGHLIMYRMYDDDSPDYDSPGHPPPTDCVLADSTAYTWSEGFAHYWGCVAAGQTSRTGWDIEENCGGIATPLKKWNVAATLWDIEDDHDDEGFMDMIDY